jgi:flagellar basal-body rod protein FlgC
MSLGQILDIASAGMDVQQMRLQVAASNIANARTTAAPGAPAYQPLEVVVRASASGGLPRPFTAGVVPSSVAPSRVYDPGHPDADKDGFINVPGVDPISSMMDLLEISRTYEANLRAFDITRNLMQRAMEIGSRG